MLPRYIAFLLQILQTVFKYKLYRIQKVLYCLASFVQLERQQAKEEAFILTQDLDSDWKVIQDLLDKTVSPLSPFHTRLCLHKVGSILSHIFIMD